MPPPTREVEIELREIDMLLSRGNIGTRIPKDEVTRKSRSNHVVGIYLIERLPRASIDPCRKKGKKKHTRSDRGSSGPIPVCLLEMGFGFLSREPKRGRKRNGRGNCRGAAAVLGKLVYRSGKEVTGASPTVTSTQVVRLELANGIPRSDTRASPTLSTAV